MQSMTAETVRLYYDRFNAGDWEGMVSLLSEDVAHDLNQGGREIGRKAFLAFMKRMERSYKEKLEDIVILGYGSRIAAEYLVDVDQAWVERLVGILASQRLVAPK